MRTAELRCEWEIHTYLRQLLLRHRKSVPNCEIVKNLHASAAILSEFLARTLLRQLAHGWPKVIRDHCSNSRNLHNFKFHLHISDIFCEFWLCFIKRYIFLHKASVIFKIAKFTYATWSKLLGIIATSKIECRKKKRDETPQIPGKIVSWNLRFWDLGICSSGNPPTPFKFLLVVRTKSPEHTKRTLSRALTGKK